MKNFDISWKSLTLALILTGCSALPKTFTTENIMGLKVGMTSKEVTDNFGYPKSIERTTCGKEPDTWACTLWSYGDWPHDHARFFFSGDADNLILNNWKVDRD